MTFTHRPFRLGVVINPYAGIGGALALKGSDGQEIRARALANGAQKLAVDKMARALSVLAATSIPVDIFTAAGEMGEYACQSQHLSAQVVYTPANIQTESQDTENAVNALLSHQIDLLLFAGGDGTARNICHVVGNSVAVLGVPAGCKIHSGVYAVTPNAAGEVLVKMARGELVSEMDAEVRDIDESAFRQGKVLSRYYGEMRVPNELEYIQAVKMGGKENEALVLTDIADHVIELMDEQPQTLFIMGSGSTVAAIMDELSLPNTLLGVDVIRDKQLLATDVSAQQLLELMAASPCKLVITAIGGQGHVFGRGNQQLSPEVLARLGRDNFVLVATKQKLQSLAGRPLRLDTGDEQLDRELAGLQSVITGYHNKVLYPIK
jgi:predicted polyphosphate/ATP-dependent NAD kinase